MEKTFKVAPVWLWFMAIGFLFGTLTLAWYLRTAQYTALYIISAFLLYTLSFLLNYLLRGYISIREGKLFVVLPPFFFARVLDLAIVAEYHAAGGPNILLITRDGREFKVPLGFIQKNQRESVKKAISEALPADTLGRGGPGKKGPS
ncbi:hypothetical protein KKF84_04000 [Myxococcota bacterium]|nr:hypothetical protein [Myxococcota bacterium]